MSVDQETEPDFSAVTGWEDYPGFDERAARCVASPFKRLIDIIGSAAGLIILVPGLILIGLAIRFQDGGPIFFRQERTGIHGKSFRIWKFRTMQHQTAQQPFEQTKGNYDPRVTSLGRWLRAWSLDELPQLINVFTGDMSLVGPRPHPVELDAVLAPRFSSFALRYTVRPGITGIAQIKGARGPITDLSDMQRRLDFDLRYIRSWSVGGDVLIALATLRSLRSDRSISN